jgi:dTDP-4-amino-4,6-dideoxygalactose transaminase
MEHRSRPRRETGPAGNAPLFPSGLQLVHPSIPDPDLIAEDVKAILASGILTNGSRVRELEERAAQYLGVQRCVAVASCTAGLMLVLRAAELSGDVIVPSFTFAATAHAVAWNGLRPVFADVDPDTLTLSAEAVDRAIGVRTSGVLATHVFGTPCDIEGLEAVTREHGVSLFFDAAHGFGSEHRGVRVGGFGEAEVFSLSPTKVLIAGEGGIIATNDEGLAERCRIGRDYGNPGDYDCVFVGLNARMSEFHAAIAIRSLADLDERIDRRNMLAAAYKSALSQIPGIRFPLVPDGDRTTFKDFTILVDAESFGLDAAGLAAALAHDGIDTRHYYSPPVHQMRAYRDLLGVNGHLPVTEVVSGQVLTLPLWTDMAEDDVARVAEAVMRSR